MAVKTILTEPNKLLRQISKPVKEVGREEMQLMDDMLETMYEAPGIGLAAVQVGILKRILVIDVSKKDKKNEPMTFINPVIKKVSEETSIYEEGCLSIPDQTADVERPAEVEVT